MLRSLLTLLLLSTAFSPLSTAEGPADRLEARGIQLRKDKEGRVTEVSVGYAVKMTLGDYQRIGQLKGVKRMFLNPQGLPLNDETLAAMRSLDTLESFFANAAQLTDEGFKVFAGWKDLESLGLDHWGWFKAPSGKTVFGKELAHLAHLPKLKAIRLGGCRVDTEAPTALAKIKTLEKVDLFHCYAVTDDGVAALVALPKLRSVTLGPQFTPRITDRSLEHLGKVRTLEELDISETLLTYANGFRHLKKLESLKTIRLKNVAASAADIDRLKADHPKARVEWTAPDAAATARLREEFKKARAGDRKE